MRLYQKTNTTGRHPQGGRWHGDIDRDQQAEFLQHRIHARKGTPSASSAVVETVYVKPRAYADIHEHDERQPSDRVPTAVGFHSFDSYEDIKSRRSRYEVALESEGSQLDWMVEIDDDPSSKLNEDVSEEREPPPPTPTPQLSGNDVDMVSDLGRYATVTNDEETYQSEDSDSCPAVWISESQEDERLCERDYLEAVEEARRVRELNDISKSSGKVVPKISKHAAPNRKINSSNKATARKPTQNQGLDRPLKGVERRDFNRVEVNGLEAVAGSGKRPLAADAATKTVNQRDNLGWGRFLPPFLHSNHGGEDLSLPNKSEKESIDAVPDQSHVRMGPVDLDDVSASNSNQPQSRTTASETQAFDARDGSIIPSMNDAEQHKDNTSSQKSASTRSISSYKHNGKQLDHDSADASIEAKLKLTTRSSKTHAVGIEESKRPRNDSTTSVPPRDAISQEDDAMSTEKSKRFISAMPVENAGRSAKLEPLADCVPDDTHLSHSLDQVSSLSVKEPSAKTLVSNGKTKSDVSSDPCVGNRSSTASFMKQSDVDSDRSENQQQPYQQQQATAAATDPSSIFEKRSSTRSDQRSSRQEATDTDVDTFNTEADSYASSIQQVSNDDIIKAVRGEVSAHEVDTNVVNKIDGFTSWIISGFDSIANSGLRAPIGFLDWSGEELHNERAKSGESLHNEHGVSIVKQKNYAMSHPKGMQTPLTNDDAVNCSNQENSSRIANTVTDQRKSCDMTLLDGKFHDDTQLIQQQEQAERERSDEVKSLNMESGVEAVATENSGHRCDGRNEKSLGANPKKVLRDSVSISSIEIPTPYRVDKSDDAHSVSVLGLEKEKVVPSAETKASTEHPKQNKEIPDGDKKPQTHHYSSSKGRETRLQKMSLREEQPSKPVSRSSRKTKDRRAVKKAVGKKSADAPKAKTGKKKKPFSLFGRRS